MNRRIALLQTRIWPAIGGAELHMRELCHMLSERQWRIQVVCLCRENRTDWPDLATGRLRETICEEGLVTVTEIGVAPRLREICRLASTLNACSPVAYRLRRAALIRGYRPSLCRIAHTVDLVLCVQVGEPFLAVAALHAARNAGKPFVFMPLAHPKGWERPELLKLYRQADALVAMTEAEREWLIQRGADPGRVWVTGVGPVGRPDPESAIRVTGDPLILFLGQKHLYKGPVLLLDAIPSVLEKHPNAHFVLAGPDTGEFTVALQSRTVSNHVIVYGKVTEEQKWRLLRQATLLCVPSVGESFGGVYVEAWAAGKPVIAADIPAVRELIDEIGGGIVVEPTPSGVGDGIIRLLDDPGYAQTLGEIGRLRTLERYSWARLAEVYEQLFEAVSRGG